MSQSVRGLMGITSRCYGSAAGGFWCQGREWYAWGEGVLGVAWEDVNRASFSRQARAFDSSGFVQGPREVGVLARLAQLEIGQEVLEVACGTGVVLCAVAPLVRHAVGLDLTPAMLAIARERVPGNVTLAEGRADALPFGTGRFDVVLNRLAVHHFAEPDACLREMARVLRPGGRLVLADLYCSSDEAQARLCNQIERLRDPAHVAFYSGERLRQMVEAAGLEVLAEERWESVRTLTEWTAITAPPGGMAELRRMMLATAPGDAAGMAITLAEGGEVQFVHRWLCLAAHKPG